MKPLQLDFSSRKRQQRYAAGIAAAAMMLLITLSLVLHQRDILGRIAQAEARNAGSLETVARHAIPSESEQRETKAAFDAQRALNLPWNELLPALEHVQSQVATKIHLTSLQPNTVKGEVTISGEATDFAILMDYVKLLRAQPVFAEVVLLNQRNVDSDGHQRLGFTLSAGWKI